MKHDVLELRSADLASRGSLWFKEKLVPAAKNSPLLTAAVLFSLLASIYWFFIASDRYVSEAHVIIQRTELTGGTPTDFAGILTGGSSINRGDQLILRDYLRSVDMVRSEEHTSELQSLMRISYADLCLKEKTK